MNKTNNVLLRNNEGRSCNHCCIGKVITITCSECVSLALGTHREIAALLVGRSRDRFTVLSLGIFSVVPSDKTMCPEVDSASENEYHGFLLG